jgi:hypothetical protein
MAITRRQDLPDTFVRLLAWIVDDTGRTLRFIALFGGVLFFVVLGITVGTSVAEAEGIRIHPAYLLPTGLFGGGSALIWIIIAIRGLIRKWRQQLTAGNNSPPRPDQSRAPQQARADASGTRHGAPDGDPVDGGDGEARRGTGDHGGHSHAR